MALFCFPSAPVAIVSIIFGQLPPAVWAHQNPPLAWVMLNAVSHRDGILTGFTIFFSNTGHFKQILYGDYRDHKKSPPV